MDHNVEIPRDETGTPVSEVVEAPKNLEEQAPASEVEELTPEQQEEQEEAATVSSIAGEWKSWQRTLDAEQDGAEVQLLRDGYDKMLDTWLDELADIDTEEAIELARQLNKTKDGIAKQ